MIYGLSDRIRLLRNQKGLNQVQLAERLGISKSAVNAWENGTNSPALIYIIKMSQIFGVSTDFILGVNQRLTVDITGLDELQQQAVTLMVKLFERDNTAK